MAKIKATLAEIDSDNGRIRNVLFKPRGLKTIDGDGVEETTEKTPIRPKDPDCRDTPERNKIRKFLKFGGNTLDGNSTSTVSRVWSQSQLSLEWPKE